MALMLRQETEKLRKMLLAQGAAVEESVRMAVLAVQHRDHDLARRVIDRDREIDETEVAVEEEGIQTLALYQPVAIDLRSIVMVLEVNNDLERVADLAVNIADRALALALTEPIEIPFNLVGMSDKVQAMLSRSLDALVHLNADLARQVCASDDEVDELNRMAFDATQESIRRDPNNVAAYISLLSVSRNLERIADHATNIAQDVIFLVEGRIIRHRLPN